METSEHLRRVGVEASALAEAARAAGPEVAIPSCPGWTMTKLLKHAGTTHRWAAANVLARPDGPVSPRELDLGLPGTDAGYPDWLEEGAARFVEVTASVPPDEAAWAWGADHHVRFWPRRMAHETAVHRWDAQAAALGVGGAAAIEGELAVDQIDELLENLPFVPNLDLAGGGETLHLHRTDGNGEWLIRWEPTGITVSREHAKGDVAVRAAASDLALLLAGRIGVEGLEVFGDPAVVVRWQQRITI